MSCNTLEGIDKSCLGNLGGIRRLFLVKLEDIDTIDGTDYWINVLTLSSGTEFVELVLNPNSASYNVSYSKDFLGIEEYAQTITFKVNRRRRDTHNAIYTYLNGNPNIVAMVETVSGDWVLLGRDNGLNIDSVNGGNAGTKDSGVNYDIELSGVENSFEYFVKADVAESVI